MRIQTAAQQAEEIRAWRLLRADLTKCRIHSAKLAEELTATRRELDTARDELAAINSSVVQAHRELLASNQQLRIANRQLHKQVENAGGQEALTAIERAERAKQAAAEAVPAK